MHPYLILLAAIIFEVIGTMLLPVSQNFSKLIPTIILLLSYVLSFYCLALISSKIPLAIIYASWSGIGLFLVTILSIYFYKDPINWPIILGLLLIIIGVVIVNVN